MPELPNLKPHPLLTELLKGKTEDIITYQGYVGYNDGNHILLYEDMFDLSNSFEISVKDIIVSAEAPKSNFPFGGVVVWLKKGSEVINRSTERFGNEYSRDIIRVVNDTTVQISAGRIAMVVSIKPAPIHPCGRPSSG